jgi:hypothetical protein
MMAAAESFPWLDRRVTLVRVTSGGAVTQAKSDGEKRAMLGNADDDDLLLAAWPGEWSQDVFVVDDLKGARASLGLPRYKAVATSAALPVGRNSSQADGILCSSPDPGSGTPLL